MGTIGRKEKLPLRGPGSGAERLRPSRPDPRLGKEVAPWGVARTMAVRCPVVLGSDYPLMLAGLQAVLAADPGLHVAGRVDGTLAALREPGLRTGMLVLASAGWTGRHAEALAALHAGVPNLRVVLLTDEADTARLGQYRSAGGHGLLRLNAAAPEILAAVQAARPARAEDWITPEASLSEREAVVMRGKVNGHATKAIAADLGISVKTVETYYARGMEKLGLKNRVEMLQYGVAQGWITGPYQETAWPA